MWTEPSAWTPITVTPVSSFRDEFDARPSRKMPGMKRLVLLPLLLMALTTVQGGQPAPARLESKS